MRREAGPHSQTHCQLREGGRKGTGNDSIPPGALEHTFVPSILVVIRLAPHVVRKQPCSGVMERTERSVDVRVEQLRVHAVQVGLEAVGYARLLG